MQGYWKFRGETEKQNTGVRKDIVCQQELLIR